MKENENSSFLPERKIEPRLTLSIVIPTKDEVDNIKPLLDSLLPAKPLNLQVSKPS